MGWCPVFVFMKLNKKLIWSLLIISLIGLIGLIYYNSYWLVIKEAKTGKVIWEQKLTADTKFAIKYLHSVQQTPVWEYFKVVEGQLYLTGTKYESYGAGLPFLPQHEYIVDQGQFIIKEINRKLANIPLRVSDYARHRLIINDQTYKLFKLTKPQNLVLIQVEERNYLDLLVGVGGRNNG